MTGGGLEILERSPHSALGKLLISVDEDLRKDIPDNQSKYPAPSGPRLRETPPFPSLPASPSASPDSQVFQRQGQITNTFMHTNRRNRSSQPIQGKTMTVPDYQAAFPVSEW
eukprot:CAMPEP_0177610830 /NCGR_PEP_ID=MMETSP0419_2-20121207/20048_1 /TAXON_ID=582737 /ORGANISM="Tetraselmis sp., Strain GSL018" /LENGTH=111 /DNA_ID=CAMNT_0019106281 /DNA_START=286 /DNA_END=619 /DNA_ORIENTATION=-